MGLRGVTILCVCVSAVAECMILCVCARVSVCVSVCAQAHAHFPSRRIHSFHQILKGICDLLRFRTTHQDPSALGSMTIYN